MANDAQVDARTHRRRRARVAAGEGENLERQERDLLELLDTVHKARQRGEDPRVGGRLQQLRRRVDAVGVDYLDRRGDKALQQVQHVHAAPRASERARDCHEQAVLAALAQCRGVVVVHRVNPTNERPLVRAVGVRDQLGARRGACEELAPGGVPLRSQMRVLPGRPSPARSRGGVHRGRQGAVEFGQAESGEEVGVLVLARECAASSALADLAKHGFGRGGERMGTADEQELLVISEAAHKHTRRPAREERLSGSWAQRSDPAAGAPERDEARGVCRVDDDVQQLSRKLGQVGARRTSGRAAGGHAGALPLRAWARCFRAGGLSSRTSWHG
eukprot:5484913-Prymnesium_polylepis.1